jgi:hypothetical protein
MRFAVLLVEDFRQAFSALRSSNLQFLAAGSVLAGWLEAQRFGITGTAFERRMSSSAVTSVSP